MVYAADSSCLVAVFKNLSLKKIKRSDSKVDQVVTEEKFALVFRMAFTLGDINFVVRKLSLPVVVVRWTPRSSHACAHSPMVLQVVHGNQLPNAEATVLWDHSFSQFDRIPFAVPASVAWLVGFFLKKKKTKKQ